MGDQSEEEEEEEASRSPAAGGGGGGAPLSLSFESDEGKDLIAELDAAREGLLCARRLVGDVMETETGKSSNNSNGRKRKKQSTTVRKMCDGLLLPATDMGMGMGMGMAEGQEQQDEGDAEAGRDKEEEEEEEEEEEDAFALSAAAPVADEQQSRQLFSEMPPWLLPQVHSLNCQVRGVSRRVNKAVQTSGHRPKCSTPMKLHAFLFWCCETLCFGRSLVVGRGWGWGYCAAYVCEMRRRPRRGGGRR